MFIPQSAEGDDMAAVGVVEQGAEEDAMNRVRGQGGGGNHIVRHVREYGVSIGDELAFGETKCRSDCHLLPSSATNFKLHQNTCIQYHHHSQQLIHYLK